METIQQQIEQAKQELAQAQTVNEVNAITNRISELEYELKQLESEQTERDQREQKVQEVNGSNSDIAIAILEAVFPETTALQAKIGLTEFGTIRTDLLQLIDGALTDRTTTLQEKYGEEMAIHDEKVRLMQKQTNEVRQQLDASEAKVKTLVTDVSHWVDRYNETAADAVKLTEDIREAKVLLTNACNEIEKNRPAIAENESLKQQITELEQKLKVAQQPKADAQLSQSFTDRMNEIKTKNEARIKSNLELAAEGALGFRGKVELPSVPQQEQPFQPNEATTSNDGNVQDMATYEASPVAGSQFPTTQAVGPIAIPGQSADGIVEKKAAEEPITRAEFELRLAQQKAEIIAQVMGEVA